MKYSEIIAQAPRLLQARDAEDYCAGATMLAELCERWGLKPFEKRARFCVYDRLAIDAAIDRKSIHDSK